MAGRKHNNPILSLLKPYRLYIIIGPVFKLIEAILELLIPTMMIYVVDNGIMKLDSAYIKKMGLVMLGIAVFGYLCALVCQITASVTSQGFGTLLRNRVFEHILGLSQSQVDKMGSATLVNRLTGDVSVLQQAVAMVIRLAIRAPFITVGSLVMAMILDIKLSLIIICVLPFLIAFIVFLMKAVIPLHTRVQKNLDSVFKISEENLSGVRVIRAFGRQEKETDRFRCETEKFSRDAVKVSRVSALLNPVTALLMNGAIVLVLWFSSGRLGNGTVSGGTVIAFVNYITYMVTALLVLANLISLFAKAYASYKRITVLLETEPEITECECENLDDSYYTEVKDGVPVLEFRNVTFGYGDGKNTSPAVSNVSFRLYRGQTLGITGVTGSGKTSLVKLVPRLYDADGGEILINGINVRKWPLKLLRSYVSLAQQQTVLFEGTIGQNVSSMNEDICGNDIENALGIAEAKDFTTEKGGNEGRVERMGSNFSGGQKQRLSVARTVLRKPGIAIFDDSLCALDRLTESDVRRNLSKLDIPLTVFVSQRISTVRSADLVIVMDDGLAAGPLSDKEMYEQSSVYRMICDMEAKQ